MSAIRFLPRMFAIRFSRNYVMLFRGCPQIDFFRGRFIPRMSAILVVKGNNEVNKSLLFCIGYTSVLGLRCERLRCEGVGLFEVLEVWWVGS